LPAAITFTDLQRAVTLSAFDEEAARQRMSPVPRGTSQRRQPAKPAAVLILVYADAAQILHTVLTLRQTGLASHSGQVSFPGGRWEEQDNSLAATALRETCEEIGICGSGLQMLAQLPPCTIPVSNYRVTPWVARYSGQPDFQPNPAEVATVLPFPLHYLLDERYRSQERRRFRGYDLHVPYYRVQGHKVWGATAMLLSGLEGRLRQVLPAIP